MPYKANFGVLIKLNVLKVPGQFNRKSLAHLFDMVISPALIRTTNEDLGFEPNFKAQLKHLKILPGGLISVDQHNDMLAFCRLKWLF